VTKYLSYAQLRQILPTVLLAIFLTIVFSIVASGKFLSSQKTITPTPTITSTTQSKQTENPLVYQCEYADDQDKATIYFNSITIRADIENNTSVLVLNRKIYIWDITSLHGVIANISFPQQQNLTGGFLSNTSPSDTAMLQKLNQRIKNCAQKAVEKNIFILPTNVSFTPITTPFTLSDLLSLQNIKKLLSSTPQPSQTNQATPSGY
jgi:hypothetical protein